MKCARVCVCVSWSPVAPNLPLKETTEGPIREPGRLPGEMRRLVPRRDILKAPGSENPARQDFGTRQDVGPGAFPAIECGHSPGPFGRSSCAVIRVPTPVHTAAGQDSVRAVSTGCRRPARLVLGGPDRKRAPPGRSLAQARSYALEIRYRSRAKGRRRGRKNDGTRGTFRTAMACFQDDRMRMCGEW